MGRYLNPMNQTKEEWLEDHAVPINDIPTTNTLFGYTAAVLVDNGDFTACALANTQQELEAFQHYTDFRPKLWFWVPNEFIGEFK